MSVSSSYTLREVLKWYFLPYYIVFTNILILGMQKGDTTFKVRLNKLKDELHLYRDP